MASNDLIVRTQKYLFATEEEMCQARLPAPVRVRLLRLRDMYTYWLQNPRMEEKAVVAEIKRRYRLGDSVAYDDVRLLKTCIGNLNQSTNEYYRWLFLQRCEEGFQMARDNQDAGAYARVLACLGKYTRLDKDDSKVPDYSVIVPQPFEMTSDPEASGFKRIPNVEEKARKLLDRFIREAEVQDVEPEEVKPLKPEMHHAATHQED